ncbi:DUF1289 domain-containing protein [Planctobacterium marinum]|uniref:DUF1289 domain-containing protein n=1 Tax=Planctobacterium marinum TaxID=1631968 RepID=UPI001E59DAAB|nr:DUF1289 domain-containing protein [Planctobacterium marinum]MCC2605418.1 DUF1289 domain-containing protein [Planctobacterium marinum]
MEQLEFFEIPSPCIGVCQVNNKGYCKGCFRSRDERVYWHQVDNAVKQQIIAACKLRKKRVMYRQNQAQKNAPSVASQSSLFDADDEK